MPRVTDVVRGGHFPAAPEVQGYRRRKILLSNPAWLDAGPTEQTRRATAATAAAAERATAFAMQQEEEKKSREAREERDALVESLLLDDPQSFIDRKWPKAQVRKLDLTNFGIETGSARHKELMAMLGEDPPARSLAEKTLKRGPATTKKLVDYGVRKGYFARDPLEIAQAKARASRTGKGLSSLLPKVSDYNTGINAWAKKYKVKAGLGLGVDEDGSLTMDMDAFTRGEQTFYEIMQGIADGSITDRRISQEEATRDLATIRSFYEGIRSRLEFEGTPVLPMPGETAPTTTAAAAPAAVPPTTAPATPPAFSAMTPAERRADPGYQAFRAARLSGAEPDEAYRALATSPQQTTGPTVIPGTGGRGRMVRRPAETPAMAAPPAAAPATRPSPAFPTAPPRVTETTTADPGAVSQAVDQMMEGARLAANTPIDVGGGETTTLAEMAQTVKDNAALLPGFLVEFFIRNPIEGAKQIYREMRAEQAGPGLPPQLS